MIKRIISIILIPVMLFSFFQIALADEENGSQENTQKQTLSAQSPYAVLVDQNTGMVLYKKNASERVYPADLTKIMTAVLVLENCKLEEVATASETALSNVAAGASTLGIIKGEKLSVRQLLYAMLLGSAADAANVLAEKNSGSIDKFVALMNEKAKELELENTNFTNPAGDHDERHYTTAEDMAKLAVYAMQKEEFREIVKSTSYSIPATEKSSAARDIKTTNRLVKKENEYYYKYSTGMKTGYTAEAKICIAASAEKNGVSVIALIFGTDAQGYKDCASMFDYVFENYESQSVVKQGEIVAQTEVVNTRRNSKLILKTDAPLSVLKLKNKDELKITYKDNIPKEISAPIKVNQIVGTREYYLGDELICTVNLIADKDYALDPVSFIVNKMIAFITSPWLFVTIILVLVVLVLTERRRRRLRRQKRREERAKRSRILEEEIEKI